MVFRRGMPFLRCYITMIPEYWRDWQTVLGPSVQPPQPRVVGVIPTQNPVLGLGLWLYLPALLEYLEPRF